MLIRGGAYRITTIGLICPACKFSQETLIEPELFFSESRVMLPTNTKHSLVSADCGGNIVGQCSAAVRSDICRWFRGKKSASRTNGRRRNVWCAPWAVPAQECDKLCGEYRIPFTRWLEMHCKCHVFVRVLSCGMGTFVKRIEDTLGKKRPCAVPVYKLHVWKISDMAKITTTVKSK